MVRFKRLTIFFNPKHKKKNNQYAKIKEVKSREIERENERKTLWKKCLIQKNSI